MSRIHLLIVGLVVMTTLSCGKQNPEMKETNLGLLKDQVLAAEDAYVSAEVSHDEQALHRLVDEHFVYNSSDGSTTGKQEFIATVLNMNMIDQVISERSVIIEGDLGIIFGTTDLTLQKPGGEDHLSRLRYTSVYVKRGDQWKMLALQMQPRS